MNMGNGRTKIQNTLQLEQRIRDLWVKHYNKSNYTVCETIDAEIKFHFVVEYIYIINLKSCS